MISANIHQAKTHLSQLVKAVEEKGETVLICRQGKPVVQLNSYSPKKVSRLRLDLALKPTAINYDPAQPLAEDEWPQSHR